MRRLTWAAVGLLLLAGCVQPSSTPTAEPVAAAADAPAAPATVASPPPPATVAEEPAPIPPPVDPWEGVDRRIVLETVARISGRGVDLLADRTIPPGTARVELLASEPRKQVCQPAFTLNGEYVCAPDPVALPVEESDSGLMLQYRHAATSAWQDVGPIVWGETSLIELALPIHADPYDAPFSLWQWRVLTDDPTDDAGLTFRVLAEAVRAEGPLPATSTYGAIFGPPIDRVVLDTDWTTSDPGVSPKWPVTAVPVDETPAPGAHLVPAGTRTLEIWLNVTRVQFHAGHPEPTHWFLFHWNTSGRTNLTDPFVIPITQEELHWVLPVDPNSWDPSYSDGSRWAFRLGGALVTPVGISCYAGCAAWTADYTLKVVASPVARDEAEYHVYCANGEC